MTDCPNCGQPLQEERGAHGIQWRCSACGGRLLTIVVLRKLLLPAVIVAVWQAVWHGEGERGRRICPECGNFLTEVRTTADSPLRLDVCRPCELFWFDPHEFEALPALPPGTTTAELPREAREAMAMVELQTIHQRFNRVPKTESPLSFLPKSLDALALLSSAVRGLVDKLLRRQPAPSFTIPPEPEDEEKPEWGDGAGDDGVTR
ncbi:MAG TPA: zf-TFIIB domain-containing protein [Armatimonadota bacterium]